MEVNMKQKSIFLFLSLIILLLVTYIIIDKKLNVSESSTSSADRGYMNSKNENYNINELVDTWKELQESFNLEKNSIESHNNFLSLSQCVEKNILQAKIHPERVTYQEGFFYEPITDKIKARINGLSYKEDCTVPYEDLRYLNVLYCNFDGESTTGEIICNKAIAQDLVEIFYELYINDYPIEKIKLIDEYNADDDLSCAENNTSSFNYRVVGGTTKLSKHALGLAIDINPFYNPYVTYPNGVERISPPGSEPYANRNADLPYMIKKGDLCYNLFIQHGFTWGGEWNTLKDYQHFQKK